MSERNKPIRDIFELSKLISQHNINGLDKKRYYELYLESKARSKYIPFRGTFELTPFCNLDCKMCYIHMSNEKHGNEELLPLQEWIKLIDEAHQKGMMRATLTGGECLTYPDFDSIYVYLRSKGIQPAVLTNGLLVDKERLSFFCKYPPRLIQITLYGSNNEIYKEVTGHRVFDIVLENIIRTRDAGVPLMLTITPNKNMENDIDSLIRLAESLNIPYQINSLLLPPRKETKRKDPFLDFSIDQYIEIYKMKLQSQKEKITPITKVDLINENDSGSPSYGLECGGGRSSFTIKYDGSMILCSSMDESCSYPLRIGFSEAWKEINHIANTIIMPQECSGCVYKSVCMTCPAAHRKALNQGHCDKNICNRTKKMIKEGIIDMPICTM